MLGNLVNVGHIQLVLNNTEILGLADFTSSHPGHMVFWQVTLGLLQGKVQDPGAVLDPRLGLVPALSDGLLPESLEQLPELLSQDVP